MMQPFRLEPKLPAHAVKTYQIAAPQSTHRRKATCQEVECANHIHGWRTMLDLATDHGVRAYKYIREHSGRTFLVAGQQGTIITLEFCPGQQCFAEHTVSLEREPLYVVREGDWRGNPRRADPVRRTADQWVDEFAAHQDRIATEINKG